MSSKGNVIEEAQGAGGKIILESSSVKIIDQAYIQANAKLKAGFAIAAAHWANHVHAMGEDAEEPKDSDLLAFEFILCHTGKNSNSDNIPLEELKKKVNAGKVDGIDIFLISYQTPVGEPLDEDHDTAFKAIVGDIISSELVEDPQNPEESSYIKCTGVVYRKLYPAVAFKLIRGAEQGYCKISMECEFERSEGSKKAPNGRILRGINFRGAAFTRFPADHEDPRILTVKASLLATLQTPTGEPALPVNPDPTDQERPAVVPDGPTSGATMSLILARKALVESAQAAVVSREAELAKADLDLEALKEMIKLSPEEKACIVEDIKERIARIKGYIRSDLECLSNALEELAKLEGETAEANATKLLSMKTQAKTLQLVLASDESKKEGLATFATAMAKADKLSVADANTALQHMQEAMKQLQGEVGAPAAAPPAAPKEGDAPPAKDGEGIPPKKGEDKPAEGAPPAPGAGAPAAPPHVPAPAGAPSPTAPPAPAVSPASPPPAVPVAAPVSPMSDAELAQAAQNLHTALHGEQLDPAAISGYAKAFYMAASKACMAAPAQSAPAPVAIPATAPIAPAPVQHAAASVESEAEAVKEKEMENAMEADKTAEAKAAADLIVATEALKKAEADKAAAELAVAAVSSPQAGGRAHAGISTKNGKVRITDLSAARAEASSRLAQAAEVKKTAVAGAVPTSFSLSAPKSSATASAEGADGKYKKGSLAQADIFGRRQKP